MTEPTAPVVLRTEVEVNGHTIMAQQLVPRRNWEGPEQSYRDFVSAELLRTLGDAIVRELEPSITVHMPSDAAELTAAVQGTRCGIGRAAAGSLTCASYPDCTCGG